MTFATTKSFRKLTNTRAEGLNITTKKKKTRPKNSVSGLAGNVLSESCVPQQRSKMCHEKTEGKRGRATSVISKRVSEDRARNREEKSRSLYEPSPRGCWGLKRGDSGNQKK